MKARILILAGSLILSANLFSQDPDFHIYLCFGQSNMEGQGTIQPQDRTVDSRFQVLQALDCSGRTRATWYGQTPFMPMLVRSFTCRLFWQNDGGKPSGQHQGRRD